MEPIDIPVGGGTFVANSGDVFNIAPNATGNIIFQGATDFTVNITGSLTGGSNIDNGRVIRFDANTEPTVNIDAGVDSSPYQIDANGSSLTVNIGDGANVGTINADSVNGATGTFDLNVGNNVTVNGVVDGPNATSATNFVIGDDFTVTSNLTGSAGADNTMSFGENLDIGGRLTASGSGDTVLTVGSGASIGNSLDLRGTGDRSAVFGDDATIIGNVDVRSSGANKSIIFGDNARITNDVNLSNSSTDGDVFIQTGDNLVVNGNFVTGNFSDSAVIGNNWTVGGAINLLGGNDDLTLGSQSEGTTTSITGSTGTDGLTVTAPAGQEAAFRTAALAANYIDNGDGTFSGQSTSSGFSYSGVTYSSWERPSDARAICFAAGTRIEVANGETVNVEDLCQGDMVMTADHGLQVVKWIGTNTLSGAELAENLRPIRIAAGALGNGLPVQDLFVSPQHRMLVRSGIAQRMFGQDEVLVAAKHLVLLDGIDVVADAQTVVYVHFLCDQHEVVFANGAPSETLYTGAEAIKSLSPDAIAEIMALFPELTDVDYNALSARALVGGRKGRQLAVRHKNNHKTILAPLH